jgi:hypothetical protein
LALASWPTTPPTAPDAALTATVSPGLGSQIMWRPYQAVTPGMPTAPRYAEIGIRLVSILRSPGASPSPDAIEYSCQPPMPRT